MNLNVGNVFGVKGGRVVGDYVITRQRRVTRGRNEGKIEYQLAPMRLDGKYLSARVIGTQYFGSPSRMYSQDEITQAMDHKSEGLDKTDAIKRRRTVKRQEQSDELDLCPGDEVTIRGLRGPNWTATVAKINPSTGKVGIARDAEVIADANQRKAERDRLAAAFGPLKTIRVSKVRWIAPQVIIKVVRNGTEIWRKSA